MEISFYHLTSTNLEKAVSSLLDKVISSGKKAVIILKDQKTLEEIDQYLWSFSTKTLLPHGTENDPYKNEQPIYLTTKYENPNNASIVMVTFNLALEKLENVEKLLDIFNGNDDIELKDARERWKNYKSSGAELNYWKQNDKGGWEKAGN